MKKIKIISASFIMIISTLTYTQVKLTASWQSTETNYYDISGDKLSDIYNKLEGKLGSGTCEGFLNYGRDYNYKQNNNIITELTIYPKCIITLPKWSNYSSAGQQCKSHFDKVVEALKNHENGHCKIVKKVIGDLENYLKNNQVKTNEISNLLNSYAEKLNDEYKSYDSQTDHGRKDVSFDNIPNECK